MKITAYNHHARLLSSRASWSFSRNQFTQVEGADAVMQSSILRSLLNEWETIGAESIEHLVFAINFRAPVILSEAHRGLSDRSSSLGWGAESKDLRFVFWQMGGKPRNQPCMNCDKAKVQSPLHCAAVTTTTSSSAPPNENSTGATRAESAPASISRSILPFVVP